MGRCTPITDSTIQVTELNSLFVNYQLSEEFSQRSRSKQGLHVDQFTPEKNEKGHHPWNTGPAVMNVEGHGTFDSIRVLRSEM